MALPSSDPKVLLGNAKCWSCLTTTYQLRVETYFLATLVGVSTTAAGVASLSASATCFGCLTNPQLRAVKAYLMALTTGAATDAAGVRALAQSAKCWDCLTPKQRLQVEVYLFAVSAGNATDVSGVRSATAAAKCFSCLETKQLYEVQVYLLSLLSPATSTAPSDLLAAAKCFVECLTPGMLSTVASSLAASVAGNALPPCVTPSAPFFVQVAQRGVTDTSTQLSVRWQQLPNTGSLITSYTVKWGTTAGGPYTNNSGPLTISPKFYIATGLTAGTTYYFVVVANSFSGCSSANSVEANGTTTGAPPTNGLLNGLISYWKFDVDVSPYADSVGANPLTGSSTNAAAPGIINTGLFLGLGSSHADHVDNADFSPPANTSMAFSMWVRASDWTVGPGQALLLVKGTGGAGSSYIVLFAGTNNLRFAMWDSTNTAYAGDLTPGLPTNNVFHHVVISFDSPNKLVTAYYDGALISSQATATGSLQVNANVFQLGVGAGNSSKSNLTEDEIAMWHKALTQTDVTNIFNGGACLPLSSYQA